MPGFKFETHKIPISNSDNYVLIFTNTYVGGSARVVATWADSDGDVTDCKPNVYVDGIMTNQATLRLSSKDTGFIHVHVCGNTA